ncbi:SRPBCC family protein [Paenibacillus mendelii]|uniref:SRPBCC family protein n=1 Tax=Paenibacillus mendelii TaxID=206163 RepID=A0ABV6JE94_9BACL|nr:SRPBCC family protein [Paenibacillus mendelii]MCQ6557113.1 SRPBCC family protein [Paenibacillus mendelii]
MKTIHEEPVVQAQMLIRKPVDEVFEAFIDPAITTKFWFTKSSGRLEAGKRVQWDWEMYGASAEVEVLEIEKNKRILIDFGSRVEWIFTPHTENETYVSITNTGFMGEGDDIVRQAIDSTEGFTIVLCGLKALLEHNVVLNLVADKAPDAHVNR